MKCLNWMLFIYGSSASGKRKLEVQWACQEKIVNPCLDSLILAVEHQEKIQVFRDTCVPLFQLRSWSQGRKIEHCVGT